MNYRELFPIAYGRPQNMPFISLGLSKNHSPKDENVFIVYIDSYDLEYLILNQKEKIEDYPILESVSIDGYNQYKHLDFSYRKFVSTELRYDSKNDQLVLEMILERRMGAGHFIFFVDMDNIRTKYLHYTLSQKG